MRLLREHDALAQTDTSSGERLGSACHSRVSSRLGLLLGAAWLASSLAVWCLGRESLIGLVAQRSGALRGLSEATPSYTVVVDCGSSHTTLHVFQAVGGRVQEVTTNDPHYPPELGPLTDFLGDAAGLQGNFASLIAKSLAYVPEAQRARTPLYVYATAGMRLLPHGEQQAALEAVVKAIQAANVYSFEPSQARTISEEMEALFAYLAVNQEACEGISPCEDTVGIVEMGGASLQVAFSPDEPIMEHEWLFNVGLGRHAIYAKGYMRYGINEAQHKTIEILAARVGNVSTLVHPCFLRGHHEDVDVQMWTREEGPVDARLVGSGDPEGCSELVQSILHLDYECDMPPCTIRGEYMPEATGTFVGLSGFRYALRNAGLPLNGSSPRSLRRNAEEFCTREASSLPGPSFKHLKSQCFLAWYAYHVLRALGFDEEYEGLDCSQEVKWPAGAVLYETVFSPQLIERRMAVFSRS